MNQLQNQPTASNKISAIRFNSIFSSLCSLLCEYIQGVSRPILYVCSTKFSVRISAVYNRSSRLGKQREGTRDFAISPWPRVTIANVYVYVRVRACVRAFPLHVRPSIIRNFEKHQDCSTTQRVNSIVSQHKLHFNFIQRNQENFIKPAWNHGAIFSLPSFNYSRRLHRPMIGLILRDIRAGGTLEMYEITWNNRRSENSKF